MHTYVDSPGPQAGFMIPSTMEDVSPGEPHHLTQSKAGGVRIADSATSQIVSGRPGPGNRPLGEGKSLLAGISQQSVSHSLLLHIQGLQDGRSRT